MKLKLTLYGQRDPRWSSILLGYNTQAVYSIGNYGCLITCLAMQVNKTPDQVNQILKDNGGFTSGSGNLIWSKTAVLGLNNTYTSPAWDGPVTAQGIQKAKDYLDQGYPLITEVDFNPNTTTPDQHFVNVVGYEGDEFFIDDPWTGTERNLSVYGGFARAVIKYRVYDKKFPKVDDNIPDYEALFNQCRYDRDDHWDDLQVIKSDLEIVGDYSLELIRTRIDGLLKVELDYGKKEKQLADANQKIADAEAELKKILAEKEEMRINNAELTVKVNESTEQLKAYDAKVVTLTGTIEKLKDQMADVITESGKPLKEYTFWQWLRAKLM